MLVNSLSLLMSSSKLTVCKMGNVRHTALKFDDRDILKWILLNKKPSVAASFENSDTNMSVRHI